jgi:hypothetical protein
MTTSRKRPTTLELDLNRRLKGKARPDSLGAVQHNLSLDHPDLSLATRDESYAELGRILSNLKSAKSGLFTANKVAAGLKLPVAKDIANAMKVVEKCIAKMDDYEVAKG